MNVASSISSSLHLHGVNPTGVSISDYANVGLVVRIWMWMSHLCGATLFSDLGVSLPRFHCGPSDMLRLEELRLHTVSRPPNRHGRRMTARRARGIMPSSRYRCFGAAGPLHQGSSPSVMRDWVRRRGTKGRFQSVNWRFYVKAFFRRAALWDSRKCAATSQELCTCRAPLSPD